MKKIIFLLFIGCFLFPQDNLQAQSSDKNWELSLLLNHGTSYNRYSPSRLRNWGGQTKLMKKGNARLAMGLVVGAEDNNPSFNQNTGICFCGNCCFPVEEFQRVNSGLRMEYALLKRDRFFITPYAILETGGNLDVYQREIYTRPALSEGGQGEPIVSNVTDLYTSIYAKTGLGLQVNFLKRFALTYEATLQRESRTKSVGDMDLIYVWVPTSEFQQAIGLGYRF